MDPFVCSLISVLIIFTSMFFITISQVFNNVELEIGLEYYAEIPWFSQLPNLMPLNSLINIGYTGLGLYWCFFTHTASHHGILKKYDTHLFFAFNIMASLYGCVQMARIVTQEVKWAILDQWCTLPFFALLLVWGLYCHYGWSLQRCMVIIFFSLFSYILTLISRIGFEICLGCHIIGAIAGGLTAYFKHPAEGSLFYIYAAIISCSGFVILKLLDMKLASFCFIFKYVSGHFLSKICDIYQIHFVNGFFFDISLQKAVDLSVMDKQKWISKQDEISKLNGSDIPYENPVTLRRKKL